jgi:hypothetical protein
MTQPETNEPIHRPPGDWQREPLESVQSRNGAILEGTLAVGGKTDSLEITRVKPNGRRCGFAVYPWEIEALRRWIDRLDAAYRARQVAKPRVKRDDRYTGHAARLPQASK